MVVLVVRITHYIKYIIKFQFHLGLENDSYHASFMRVNSKILTYIGTWHHYDMHFLYLMAYIHIFFLTLMYF